MCTFRKCSRAITVRPVNLSFGTTVSSNSFMLLMAYFTRGESLCRDAICRATECCSLNSFMTRSRTEWIHKFSEGGMTRLQTGVVVPLILKGAEVSIYLLCTYQRTLSASCLRPDSKVLKSGYTLVAQRCFGRKREHSQRTGHPHFS